LAWPHIRLKQDTANQLSIKMKLPPHDPHRVVSTDGLWDPDLSNGLRAESAKSAALHYHRLRDFNCDEATCALDLLTDTLHYLHSLGNDPLDALARAKVHFEQEISEDGPPLIIDFTRATA
jgi:hypothetical protein